VFLLSVFGLNFIFQPFHTQQKEKSKGTTTFHRTAENDRSKKKTKKNSTKNISRFHRGKIMVCWPVISSSPSRFTGNYRPKFSTLRISPLHLAGFLDGFLLFGQVSAIVGVFSCLSRNGWFLVFGLSIVCRM
jgi:hypothetical protein